MKKNNYYVVFKVENGGLDEQVLMSAIRKSGGMYGVSIHSIEGERELLEYRISKARYKMLKAYLNHEKKVEKVKDLCKLAFIVGTLKYIYF